MPMPAGLLVGQFQMWALSGTQRRITRHKRSLSRLVTMAMEHVPVFVTPEWLMPIPWTYFEWMVVPETMRTESDTKSGNLKPNLPQP